ETPSTAARSRTARLLANRWQCLKDRRRRHRSPDPDRAIETASVPTFQMLDVSSRSLPRFASDPVAKSTSQTLGRLDVSHFPGRKFHEREAAGIRPLKKTLR